MRAPILPCTHHAFGPYLPAVVATSLVLIAASPKSFASDRSLLGARADRQIQSGAYVDALTTSVMLLRECLTAYGPRTPETIEALRRVGTTLREMGDLELADAVWRVYHAAASDLYGACDSRVAEATYQLGAAAKGVSNQYDDILPYYLEALSLLDASRPDHQVLRGRITRAEAHYYRYRNKTRSIEKFEEAVAILDGAVPRPAFECAETRTWLGWTLLQMGRHESARRELRRAREEFHALGLSRHPLMGTIESALADLDAVAKRWSAAEQGYRRATALFVKARQDGSTRFAEFPLHGYNLLALTQLKQGKEVEAWESLQRYRSPAGKRLASLGRWEQRSRASYAAVTAVRREVVERRSLRRQKLDWGSMADVDWNSVLAELEANARLNLMEARYYAQDVATGVSLEDLQASLPADWAYVGWLDSRVADDLLCSPGPILDSRWMYIVRSRGPVRWIPLWEHDLNPPREILRRHAGAYMRMQRRAASWPLRVEDDPELAELAQELAKQEFDRALPFLDGVSQIVIEFIDEHTGLRPFECLAISGGEYLGDRFAVSYSPSAELFVSARNRPTRRFDAPSVVAIGDPIFSDQRDQPSAGSSSIDITHHRSAIELTHHRAATSGDPEALAKLPRLPLAGAELAQIQSLYPAATVLHGAEATEQNVTALLAGPASSEIDIIHVATHALAETPLRQRCSLALSRTNVDSRPVNDGLIDAFEIQLGWRLNADLVVLSGCQTASGPGWFRGEPMGLSTVLLGVGAGSVIASLWKVDDLATARLMGRFYENLSGAYTDVRRGRSGHAMSKAVALAEAKKWLRTYADDDGRKPFAHPIYWSGFILIGDPD